MKGKGGILIALLSRSHCTPHTFGPAHGSRKRNALQLASSLTRGTTLGETDHAPNSPRPPRENPPPQIPPKSQIQPPFGQLANNIPQTPSPCPPPLHSLRQSRPPRQPICRRHGSVILSLPQYALVDCRPLAAPPPLATFLWRRTAVSAATAGDVRVETHGGQLLPRYAHSRLRPRACRSSTEC